MNAKVEKKINGVTVSAKPVFKGGYLPAYWSCSIDERIISRTFNSASDVFRFVKNVRHH